MKDDYASNLMEGVKLSTDQRDARWDLITADLKELEEQIFKQGELIEFHYKEHSSFYHKLEEQIQAMRGTMGDRFMLLEQRVTAYEHGYVQEVERQVAILERVATIEAACKICIKEGKD